MLVLAIDTATPAVTAGAVEFEERPRTVASRVVVDARAHAELLTPQVRVVLDEAGAGFGDLGAIVVGVGPGPFTGLRVGIVSALAFGEAAGVPVHPVCSLDAIAAQAPAPVLVATDARRREVYWAGYGEDGARSGEPGVAEPATLAGHGYPRAAGAGARRYTEVLGVPVVEPQYPAPDGLVAAAAPALRAGTDPAPVVPMYLRRPHAQAPAGRKRVLPV